MSPLRLALAATVLLSTLVPAPRAGARPLRLDELYALSRHLDCVDGCAPLPATPDYLDHVARETCLAACGHAPRLWEKNGVAPVDRADHELALLEYMDAQDPTRELVCYRDADRTIVVPGALCAGETCESMPTCDAAECAVPTDVALVCRDDEPGGPRCWWPEERRPSACPDVVCAAVANPDVALVRSFQQCADGDGDGLPAWLEEQLGRDDGTPDRLCGAGAACGFDETCAFEVELGTGVCLPRDCGEACTAFHLELVAEDDVEVLVHVHYDGSPVPARVLTLHLTYDATALTLEDARPLAPLTLRGKELASSHLADGTLRLDVFDRSGTWPIPTGPIVELVFRRTGPTATLVAFATDDELQRDAMAPLQGDGATQALLADDALWGTPVRIGARDEAATRLRLWYGFEDPTEPLTYAAVPTADELCALSPDCANTDDEVLRATLLARLGALQAGEVLAREALPGVTGRAVYLDGGSDHLRLPVQVEQPLAPVDQSFSYSTWFFAEAPSADERKDTPQVLYSHNGPNERTDFGLVLRTDAEGRQALLFFDGDLLSKAPPPATVPVIADVPRLTWQHVGFTLDAASGEVRFYVNGARAGGYRFVLPPPALSCPTLRAGREVLLHEEGAVLGGRAPEFVYLAIRHANLFGIERMDAAGVQRTTILRDGAFSYRDPDYHPSLDRLVFSSNATGDFEVWTARGDGSEARPLTVGFGDTTRGIAARRPRWAPDGSAIVFESDIYDVTQRDNDYARVSHLYYIGYDPVADAPAVELADGSLVDMLDYRARLDDGTIDDYRLTGEELDRHHRNARWLTGRDRTTGARGRLVMDTATPGWEGHRVDRLDIPAVLAMATTGEVGGLGDADEELRLVTAFHGERAAYPAPVVTERLLYERTSALYDTDGQYAVEASEDASAAVVRVRHTPVGYDPLCWDRDRDHQRDADEDRDGDGIWSAADCYPDEVRELFVEYDAAAWRPLLEDADGNESAPGAAVTALHKELRLRDVYPQGRAFVRVEVTSPLDATPLPADAEVAVLRFARVPSGATATVPFAPFARTGVTELLVKELTDLTPPALLDPVGRFTALDDATFSPDGTTLLLSVVSHARPLLLATRELRSAAESARILTDPVRLEGFTWTRAARFYPCNWAGGYLHFQTKLVQSGFRGGLDELKLFAGLRDEDAFRSEAERGFEALARDGRGGDLDSRLPTCSGSHADCPAYHLCIEGECRMVPCDPEDPYACAAEGGRCTLRPLTVEQEGTDARGSAAGFDWVCDADCTVDRQCFTEECLSGPCRYCDAATLTCIECREELRQLGALTFSDLAGCPDRRSFACVEGACTTECYAFEDGESVYLCDPALEYCDKGRCVLLDWSWWDLAPLSLSGLSTTRTHSPGYTERIALDQRVPVEVFAYGVSDYGQTPEVVVEARGGPVYGADWRRLGRLVVHHERRIAAEATPYVLSSPYPFTELRLRLVNGPYENPMAAATGLRETDKDFCLDDFARSAAAGGTPEATPSPCYHRAFGSRFNLGYPLGIPYPDAVAACTAQGKPACPSLRAGEHRFLAGGSPAVVVLGVTVDGADVLTGPGVTNDVCPYLGASGATLDPREPATGRPRKLIYGALATEQSNERTALCAVEGAPCGPVEGGLQPFDIAAQGFALLNCAYDDPATSEAADLTIASIPLPPVVSERGPIVHDDGDTCTVELDAARVEPCYEWLGGDASLDPSAAQTPTGAFESFASLDLGLFRSFGHDEGFVSVPLPRYALQARVVGLTGAGLVLRNGDDQVAVPYDPRAATAEGIVVTFPTTVALGRRFELAIATQPAGGGADCVVDPVLAHGGMAEGGATVPVWCIPTFRVGGTVQGLAEGGGGVVLRQTTVTAEGYPYGTEEVEASSDRPFVFRLALPAGYGYTVRVRRHPEGQRCRVENGTGTVGAHDVTNVYVVCEDIVPRVLRVDVSGLAGTGLVLRERVLGQELAVATSGAAAFARTYAAGDEYDIVVTSQPVDPFQSCHVVEGGAGTMPDADTLGARVVCADLATFPVTGYVAGLLGDGLVLRLVHPYGAENLALAPDAAAPVDIAFGTALLEGDRFLVGVLAQPAGQVCEVTNPEGTISTEAPLPIVVVCRSAFDVTTYTVGGSVTGLHGSGLRLSLNGGMQQILVEEDGAFAFPDGVGHDTAYRVTVDRNPWDPTQLCTVANGEGLVWGADVTGVRVTCTDGAKLAIEIRAPGSDGGQVRALLVSPAGVVVGQEPRQTQIASGRAAFVLRTPGSTEEAVFPKDEDYRLYVLLNRDADTVFGTTTPLFEAGVDYGLVKTVRPTENAQVTEVLLESQFRPLAPSRIILGAPVSDPSSRAVLTCYWTPAGTGELGVVPPPPTVPVIATSRRACDPTSAPCAVLDDDEAQSLLLTTTENGGLPMAAGATAYDVTCWMDADEDGVFGGSDDKVSRANVTPGVLIVSF